MSATNAICLASFRKSFSVICAKVETFGWIARDQWSQSVFYCPFTYIEIKKEIYLLSCVLSMNRTRRGGTCSLVPPDQSYYHTVLLHLELKDKQKKLYCGKDSLSGINPSYLNIPSYQLVKMWTVLCNKQETSSKAIFSLVMLNSGL